MTTGDRQKLGVNFGSGYGLPLASVDDMLTTGSLMLVEPAHPVSPWDSGIPAANARVANLAASQAGAALGDTSAEVRAQWIVGSAQASTNSIFERTSCGGLHGIASQTVTGANMGACLVLPAALLTYLKTNTGHSYFVSLWHRVTRISGGSTDATTPYLSTVANSSSPASNYLWALRSRISRPGSGGATNLGLRPTTFTDVAGPTVRSIGTTGAVGTIASPIGTVASWGLPGYNSGLDAANDKPPSWVLYRYYLEDLTVSGRSYATVDTLDKDAFIAQVTTPGGRYWSDTYTTPAI